MRELLDGAGTLTAAQRARSWATIDAAIAEEPRRRRRGRLRLVAAGVAGAAVLGATAAIVASRPVTDLSMVECRSYAADGTSLAGTEVSNASPAGSDVPATIQDAVGACAGFWRSGLLVRDVAGIHPPADWDGQLTGRLPVPPLVGCTRDDGAAVVVVGDTPQACHDAGYTPTTD
ncbi:hypothetical protein [Actinophytocola sediminis]